MSNEINAVQTSAEIMPRLECKTGQVRSPEGYCLTPDRIRLECKTGQVRSPEGHCLTPDPIRLECKQGQVRFEGRCLTPDPWQSPPAPRGWCGESAADGWWLAVVMVAARVFCR